MKNSNNFKQNDFNKKSVNKNHNDSFDLYIGHWGDILTNSESKAAFKRSVSYFSKRSKFFQTNQINFPLNADTFRDVKIKHVLLKFDSDWFDAELSICNAMTDVGKIGEAYVSIYGSIDAEIQKIITAARPTGNFFFVLGNGNAQAVVAGYAARHNFPIIQLFGKGRKPAMSDITDDPKDVTKAKILANRVVDIAQKYYYVSESVSPQKNVLQD